MEQTGELVRAHRTMTNHVPQMSEEMNGVPPPPFIFPVQSAQNGALYPMGTSPLLFMATSQSQRHTNSLIHAQNMYNGSNASQSDPSSPVTPGVPNSSLYVDTDVQSPTKKGGFYVQHFLQNEKKNSPRKRAASESVLPNSPISSGSSSKVRKKRSCTRWTEDENRKLIDAYVKYEGKNWSAIAKEVGNKTSDQCNQHWHRVLNPAISKKPWTDDEDNQLINRVNEYGESSWKKISEGLRGRTDLQCRHRWTQIKKTISKGGRLSPTSPMSKPLHINTDEYSSNSSSPTGTPNTPTPLSGRPYMYSHYKSDSPSPSQHIDPNNFYNDVPITSYGYHGIGHHQPGHLMMIDVERSTVKGLETDSEYNTDDRSPLTNYEHEDMFLDGVHHTQIPHAGYASSLQETMDGNVSNFLKLDFFGAENHSQSYPPGLPPPPHMYTTSLKQYIQPNQNRAPISTAQGLYNSAFYPMTTASAFDSSESNNDHPSTPPPMFAGSSNVNQAGSKSEERSHSPLSAHMLDHGHIDFHDSFQQNSLFDNHRMSPPTLPSLPSISTTEFGFPSQSSATYMLMKHHNE